MKAKSAIRVAIVEDDKETRAGLRALIETSPRFTCVAECASGEEALRALPVLLPDVVLMDIQLPGMSGIECIRRLKLQNPAQRILMLTVFEDPERIFNSLAAGAIGYVLKTTRPAKLLQMIAEANAGGAPMSSQVARHVVQSFQWMGAFDPISRLSPREQEVLQQLSQARPYQEISDKLGISVNTVRTHVRSIYEKLQTRNSTQAVAKNLLRNFDP